MKELGIETITASRLQGAIIGGAVGDAIGLPREGLSRRRAARIFGSPPLGHRLVFGRGMMSDDTEHACMVAQALLSSKGEPEAFARSLAWRLRGWLLGLPAGVGKATARAVIKLWIGFPPSRSGVWSAGNGPAMRAVVIGAYAADDIPLLRRLIHASTIITHGDPVAEQGALAIALAAACGLQIGAAIQPEDFMKVVRSELAGSSILPLLEVTGAAAIAQTPIDEFLKAQNMERGISGYINHTVSAAIFCWLRWPGDYRQAVEAVVCAGGDSDTTGAIVGGLVGATVGIEGIPVEWRAGLMEWPRTISWMTDLGAALANKDRSSPSLFWPGLLPRNLFFLMIVLMHGVRRLLPPY